MSIFKDTYGDYRKEVKDFRDNSKVQSDLFFSSQIKLSNTLSKFTNGNIVPINFDELQVLFPLGKWISINDKVWVKKVWSEDNTIVFYTIMAEGGVFGWHCHADCKELTEVLSGALYDSETDTKYFAGESVAYPPNQYHTPGATQYTSLLVTFTRI